MAKVWSEADSAILYTVKKTEVVVTDWDPRVKHDVPFTRRRFFLTGGKVVPSIEVLLRAPKPNPVRVDQLFRTLALSREELDASYPAQSVWPLESVLYEIRNYGLLDPQGTLIRLRQHDDSWWVDGHIGEELANIEAELELLSRTSSLGHPAAAATTRR